MRAPGAPPPLDPLSLNVMNTSIVKCLYTRKLYIHVKKIRGQEKKSENRIC